MTLFQKIFNVVILGVVIVLLFLAASPKKSVTVGGGDYNQTKQYFLDGFDVGQNANLTVNGSGAITTDLTVSGGTLNLTTSNTATSTIVAGCVEFYATSTATALKFQASTTPGVMYSQYGACPRL